MTDLSELIERLEYRVGNPSAWPEGYDEAASELFREAVAALRSQPEPAGVRVKGLVWVQVGRHGSLVYRSESAFGEYQADFYEDSGAHGWEAFYGDTHELGCFATMDEAKAAAQADYERRILSALDLSPAEPTALPERCPHCDLHWGYNPPAHVAGSDQVRCIECKTLYAAPSNPVISDEMERLRDLCRRARLMTGVMEGLTGCRGDDEWVWALQADLDAALSVKPQSGESE